MECCNRAEKGDRRKLDKLLSVKKFFSIPWLICGDKLTANIQ